MKLKLENHMGHNCIDEQMVNWCVENLDSELHFSEVFGYDSGFGCTCHKADFTELWLVKGGEEWEEWMSELDTLPDRIRIFYCPSCHEWGIDDEF